MQRRARVDDIITLAAGIWFVRRQDIVGGKRNRIFVRPRQAACLVAREHNHSLPQIARLFGNRDHSSVINGVRQALKLESRCEDYAEKLARLRRLAEISEPFVAERVDAVRRAAAAIPDKVVPIEDTKPASTKLARNTFENADPLFARQAEEEEEVELGGAVFLERLLAELAKSKLRQEREYI